MFFLKEEDMGIDFKLFLIDIPYEKTKLLRDKNARFEKIIILVFTNTSVKFLVRYE